MFALILATVMPAVAPAVATIDAHVQSDLYFAKSDPTGQYPLGWSHYHRDDASVMYESYARYPDGVFVFAKKSFRYDAQGRLKEFACSTNYPADIESDAQVLGDQLAAQVAIPGLSKVVTMPGFTLRAEMDLNHWARSAKPGDVHSFKSIDCVKAAINECSARAITTTRMLVDERRMEGLKVMVECPEANERYIVWFDPLGNELSTLQQNVLSVRDE